MAEQFALFSTNWSSIHDDMIDDLTQSISKAGNYVIKIEGGNLDSCALGSFCQMRNVPRQRPKRVFAVPFGGQFRGTCCHRYIRVSILGLQSSLSIASNNVQQPLFRPHQDIFCQKVHCLLCASGRGPSPHCIHRSCYQYFRQFPPSLTVRLRDLLELWPCFPTFLEQNSSREKHAYKEYFNQSALERLLSSLSSHGAENGIVDFIRLMIGKLPAELLSYIAELSWPCALYKPLIISEEAGSLLEFMKRGKGNVVDSLLYTGGKVMVARLNFLGSLYVSSLSNEVNKSIGCQKDLSITLIRDELGLLDVNFNGEFLLSRRGYWYKRIQTRSDHLHLRVYHKVRVLSSFSDISDQYSILSQTLRPQALAKR